MHRPRRPNRLLRTGCALVLLAAAGLGGCRRGPPLPQVEGSLVDVVIRASFEAEPGTSAPTQPLMLDSASFTRLGAAVHGVPFTVQDVQQQVTRPVRLVDAGTVLTCPARRPCHVTENGTYLEVWEATRRGDAAELVVARVFNVQGLHLLTRSAVHRMTVAPAGAGWRLSRIERLPS